MDLMMKFLLTFLIILLFPQTILGASHDTTLTVVPKDQQNPTKTLDSSKTVPPESEDHDAVMNEGVLKTAVIVGAVVVVVLCARFARRCADERIRALRNVQENLNPDRRR